MLTDDLIKKNCFLSMERNNLFVKWSFYNRAKESNVAVFSWDQTLNVKAKKLIYLNLLLLIK